MVFLCFFKSCLILLVSLGGLLHFNVWLLIFPLLATFSDIAEGQNIKEIGWKGQHKNNGGVALA